MIIHVCVNEIRIRTSYTFDTSHAESALLYTLHTSRTLYTLHPCLYSQYRGYSYTCEFVLVIGLFMTIFMCECECLILWMPHSTNASFYECLILWMTIDMHHSYHHHNEIMLHQIETRRSLGISWYKFKLRFWFNLNLYRGIWGSGRGGDYDWCASLVHLWMRYVMTYVNAVCEWGVWLMTHDRFH